MADPILLSKQGLEAIPTGHCKMLHRMYEDSDLEGAENVEELFDFLEQEAPGAFVLLQINSSASPPCASKAGHYPCDYYDPYWAYVLVPGTIWEQHKDKALAKDQAWKDAHTCKLEK